MEIIIGDRFRKELGDIDSLARSIEEIGLLHPIVVTSDGLLLVGFRRLTAWRSLGRADDDIPATVIDIANPVDAEFEENMIRKDFTPSEQVDIARAITPALEAAARERFIESKTRDAGGQFTISADSADMDTTPSSSNETRQQVADAVGTGRTRLAQATTVVEAAEADPETFGSVKEEMDRTGKVHAAYTKVTEAQEDTPAPVEQSVQVTTTANSVILVVRTEKDLSAEDLKDTVSRYEQCLVYFWIRPEMLAKVISSLPDLSLEYKTCLSWVQSTPGRRPTNRFPDDMRFAVVTSKGDAPIHYPHRTWYREERDELRTAPYPRSLGYIVGDLELSGPSIRR